MDRWLARRQDVAWVPIAIGLVVPIADGSQRGFAGGVLDTVVVGLGLDDERLAGPLSLASRVGRLAPGPILEGRADREGARQAIGFLVGGGSRRRDELRVAAVAMIGAGRPRLAIVFEGHEGAGRGGVHAREPSLGHRRR
jgi:hypothetical protein